MKGDRGLHDKPFRYSGILHQYDKTAEYFKSRPRCYACGGDMTGHKPYAAAYRILRGDEAGLFRFRLLCRECAYAYGRGVVEQDGETYEYMTDFKYGKDDRRR